MDSDIYQNTQNNRKVLIVTALVGFIRAFLLDDIKILQSMGYEVHCAANTKGDDRTLEQTHDYFAGIKVIFHEVNFSSTSPVSKDSFKAYREMSELIHKYKFDIIHSHTPIAGVLTRLAARGLRKKGSKIIYTSHGFYFHKNSSKKDWIVYYNIERFASLFTDLIVTINWEDFHNAKKMFCKQVEHINGVGVNIDKYSNASVDRNEYRCSLGIDSEDLMILSIGELSYRKNHQIIIRAISQLNNSNLVYVICGKTMVGEGTYSELKSLSKQLGVRVLFLGYRTDIPQIAHCADIGALPSRREGLGLAGIELMAAGIPIVASNVHGIVDYVKDGITGYLCSPDDEKEFAQAIDRLKDKRLRDEMKTKCIQAAKPYDRSVSYKQRQKIYKRLLENGKKSTF